jgi:excisionase family DNA binding protein
MREGKALLLLPESESSTTQAAAEFLGVSRPFVVDLLEKGAIPHHKVGTHRRVYLKDLMEYQRQRDTRRRATLDDLRSEVDEAGLYDKGTTGDNSRRKVQNVVTDSSGVDMVSCHSLHESLLLGHNTFLVYRVDANSSLCRDSRIRAAGVPVE